MECLGALNQYHITHTHTPYIILAQSHYVCTGSHYFCVSFWIQITSVMIIFCIFIISRFSTQNLISVIPRTHSE